MPRGQNQISGENRREAIQRKSATFRSQQFRSFCASLSVLSVCTNRFSDLLHCFFADLLEKSKFSCGSA